MKQAAFAIAFIFFGGTHVATASISVIDSRQNIYGAGLGSGPEILGDGLSPAAFSFAAGPNQVLRFSSVVGTVNYYANTNPSTEGPDGYGPSFYPYLPGQFPTSPLDYPGFYGLSGYRDVNNGASLVGVFLTSNPPAQPAPSVLDFSNNKSFSELSPQIGQVFYVGDGLTGTGSGDTQKFRVPANATRLYLGFIDSFFVDNLGSLTATYEITSVPEPSSILAWSLGSALLACRSRHRPSNQPGILANLRVSRFA